MIDISISIQVFAKNRPPQERALKAALLALNRIFFIARLALVREIKEEAVVPKNASGHFFFAHECRWEVIMFIQDPFMIKI